MTDDERADAAVGAVRRAQRDLVKVTRDARRRRAAAIDSALAAGASMAEVADVLGVTRQTAYSWLKNES